MANWDQGTQWDSTQTNLDIIKKAMRKLHVLAVGSQPTAAQTANGMDTLQDLIMELVEIGAFGRLQDVIADDDATAREWLRIRADSGVTITLPTTITQAIANSWPDAFSGGNDGEDYGWGSVDGTTNYPRPPLHMAPIVVVDSDGNETCSIYSAWKGQWITVNNLGSGDSFPFAIGLRNGFAAMLAERLADDFSTQVSAETARQANWCRMSITNKFGSSRRSSGQMASYM